MLLNPFVLDYPIGEGLIFNWLLYGYVVPILALALGARLLRRNREPLLGELLAVDALRPPTFFEAMTAASVEWFARSGVDFAVYEVGLGGRHDATTAIEVDAAIVTRIELEHTDKLGSTLAAIAGEKAGIVKPGAPVVIGALVDAIYAAGGPRIRSLPVIDNDLSPRVAD